MPIYEFECTSCKHAFDELLPASRRDDERLCPECGSPSRRKVSLFASRSSKGEAGPSAGGKSCSSCSSHNCSSCS